jgi:enolase
MIEEGDMNRSRISRIKAREILDSKGRPMVEVDVWTEDGFFGQSASPCGTSVGKYEAAILRDGGKRFGGLGVQRAVKNVDEVIGPALCGKSVFEQKTIDQLMIELDATPNKSRLGANAIYGASVAVARAAAQSLGLPLYRYLGEEKTKTLPLPMFNMINGGPYSNALGEFQEFLLVPASAKTYAEALRMGVEVFYQVESVIKRRYGQNRLHFGHSAGYGAPVEDPAEIIEILLAAVDETGYKGMFKIGLDCAASHFYNSEKGLYRFGGKDVTREEIIQFLEGLAETYPLLIVEDPLNEDDFEGFAEITKRLDTIVIGDDLFATNLNRLKKGSSLGAANAMIFKPNMVGTLTEAMDTAAFAKEQGYLVVPSSRAGGSVDDPIPDLAVAIGASLGKFGAPQSGERTTYHNRLLKIEEDIREGVTLPSQDLLGKKA